MANTGTAGRWDAARPSGSPPTGRRCSPCHRSRRSTGWRSSTPAARGTTTSGSTATTTRCTRPRSADGSRSSPTWHRVRVIRDGRVVADHARCWARHQTHHRPRPRGRGEGDAPRPGHRRCARSPEADVEHRGASSDYDARLGLDLGTEGGPRDGHRQDRGARRGT